MKYLRRIFESLYKKDEIQDLCDSYFAYLYDEGFEVKVEKDVRFLVNSIWNIKIYKYKSNNTGSNHFTWNEIKDYFIPFFEKLLITEDLFIDFLTNGILLKYLEPKYCYDNTWYKYPSSYDIKIFHPTEKQIVDDQIDDVKIKYNWNCMEYLYEINILIKE
jgi:hypothetical protein